MSGHDLNSAPASCENCAAPLQGHYCHACGQSVHSPTRHFGHAVEEVFESFWHLDGRVFRTLRDLLVPGRVAHNYLAGQRVRYIAPLRLFVILSLLTFFIAKLTFHIDESPIVLDGREAAIGAAKTVAEVEQIQGKLLKEVSAAEREANEVPGVNVALLAARARIRSEAANRIAELRDEQGNAAQSGDVPVRTAIAPDRGKGAETTTSATRPAASPTTKDESPPLDDESWDAKIEPVDVAWLPAFADRWLDRKIARAKDNINQHQHGNYDWYLQAFLGAVPTTLFLLMPIFALLLKVLYLGTGRGYLEHLVVALYSHAWLLLVLLATFLLGLGAGAIGAPWAIIANTVVISLLWLVFVPVYLFLMQLRVYRDHWAITAIRYVLIGTVYFFLVVTATVFAALAGLSS
jgi:hypothetical protein